MATNIQRVEDCFRDRESFLLAQMSALECDARKLDNALMIRDSQEVEGLYDVTTHSNLLSYMVKTAGMNGTGLCGMGTMTEFLRRPRMIRPNEEQEEALAHVNIHLTVDDFTSPFPVMMVELPRNKHFKGCVVNHLHEKVIITNLIARSGDFDVTTVIRNDGRPIEDYISNVNEDPELLTTLHWSLQGQRVALNMCLLLSNYGCTEEPAFPKVLATDQSLAKENSERGERARQRVRDHIYRVKPLKEIVVRRKAPKGQEVPTGCKVAGHWVRGHWKMQVFGKGEERFMHRKKIFVRPYMVHPEQLVGVPAPVTIYKDAR